MAGNYQVLARKYRPKDLCDLVGQNVAVTILSNSIKHDRVASAYILTGIRGVGKTTTARIIAKTLNCSNIDNQKKIIQACSDCSNCVSIAKSCHPDVIEMDAASNTGVNDVRDIIETTHYVPSSGKYKVYIIDEVHMLSKSAFNAILKTLEEPPDRVIFIFATTEINKIPSTVISRCQRLDMRRINTETMQKYLADICHKENFQIETGALRIISQVSEGSLRDALSLLDSCASYVLADRGHEINEETVNEILGTVNSDTILLIMQHIFIGKAIEAIAVIKNLYSQGADLSILVSELLAMLHVILKTKLDNSIIKNSHLNPKSKDSINEYATKLSMPYLLKAWHIIAKYQSEIGNTDINIASLEVLIITLVYVVDSPSPGDIMQKILNVTPAQLDNEEQIHQYIKSIHNIFGVESEIKIIDK